MLGITDYWAFVVAVLVFLALPGPGTLALLTSTGKGGFRAGAAATLGLIVGDQVLLWLAVLGVAAVLHAHPLLSRRCSTPVRPILSTWPAPDLRAGAGAAGAASTPGTISGRRC